MVERRSLANGAFHQALFPTFLPHLMRRNRRAIFETQDQPIYLESHETAFRNGVVCLSLLVPSH